MKDHGLDERETAYVSALLTGASGNMARKAAGYRSESAITRLNNDERVREAMRQALIGAGLSPDFAAQRLRAMLEAERFELSRDGSPVHLGPDNRAINQAIDTYMKVMGAYPNPRIDVNTGNQNVLVIRSDQSPIAALDPFGAPAIDAETVELPALGNPELGIAPEDDFLIG